MKRATRVRSCSAVAASYWAWPLISSTCALISSAEAEASSVAALFSSAPHASTVWGYPVLTIVFLALALLTALWVGLGMLRRDVPQRKDGRHT